MGWSRMWQQVGPDQTPKCGDTPLTKLQLWIQQLDLQIQPYVKYIFYTYTRAQKLKQSRNLTRLFLKDIPSNHQMRNGTIKKMRYRNMKKPPFIQQFSPIRIISCTIDNRARVHETGITNALAFTGGFMNW